MVLHNVVAQSSSANHSHPKLLARWGGRQTVCEYLFALGAVGAPGPGELAQVDRCSSDQRT